MCIRDRPESAAAGRSIHVTSPSPLPGSHRRSAARPSPTPIHVLSPQPHAESSTPNMGSFSATASPARRAGGDKKGSPGGPGHFIVRTPFLNAVNQLHCHQPTPAPRQNSQSVLEAMDVLQQQVYQTYALFVYEIRSAVIPWQTSVLMFLACIWALFGTRCALPAILCIMVVM